MKQTLTVSSRVLSLFSASVFLFASCEKSVSSSPQVLPVSTDKTVAESAVSQSLNPSFSPYQVLGSYSLRGSRTKYRGQANDNGDNIILSLDYFGERTVEASKIDKALTCGYGETNYVNMGWKYIIRFDKKTKAILLSPNDTMAAAIKPHSFEQRYASYDPVFHSFTFQTRFTDKDGNENEVVDILNKE